METTERVVEAYVRYVKGWATIPNIHAKGQYEIDLLAIDPVALTRYHIEGGVTVAILVMLFSAEAVAGIVNRHPTLKMLALSFLLLIGLALLLEGFDQHIPKGYIYFAMGFSVFVELPNIRLRRRREARSHPVELHQRYARAEEGSDPSQL
jgi:hypothetical protein